MFILSNLFVSQKASKVYLQRKIPSNQSARIRRRLCVFVVFHRGRGGAERLVGEAELVLKSRNNSLRWKARPKTDIWSNLREMKKFHRKLERRIKELCSFLFMEFEER